MNRPTYGYSAQDAPEPQGQPVCPRHPDTISYVRCKRCDRPACPQCQRPTQVGVLCVDCEKDIARQQASTRPRNAMGASMGGRTPYVTYTLMALCVAAFLGQMLVPGIVEQLGLFAPFRAIAMPWTFLTAGFLHGGLLHLALNMWALWIVGQYLEQTMGHARYAGLYLASVLGGHTAVYLLANPLSLEWTTATLGASGGVFGLFGAMFIVNRRMGGQSAQILVLIGLNLVITFTVPNISWQGHLGGLVVGTALAAAMFAMRPKVKAGDDRQAAARRSALIHSLLIAGAVLVCIGAVMMKYMTLPSLFF